ncbi:MAG: dTDP-4-dehydrorhamnose 3,5-epimerase [Trueperaceae bacterium]|nr:dTDP-4-dehydrorhamnose 3,5-epimerase [Trueperaceae bacterium]
MSTLFEPQAIPEVILVKPRVFKDDRGFFSETYKQSSYIQGGIKETFVQDNRSRSSRHTLRGLHYQKMPKPQGKLFSVVRGEVLDVAVDIRQGSPTFGHWVSALLNDENQYQLYIPVGFAHGFCVLSEVADVSYKTTGEYSPEHDRGVLWNDPAIAVDWQIASPLLSSKDEKQPLLKDADNNFIYGEC